MNRGLRGADWLLTPGNIAITFDSGNIALFDDHYCGEYEIHLIFTKEVNVGQSLADVREAFRRMFTEHGAELIFGLPPAARREVQLFGRWAGMASAGNRQTIDGPCALFVLSRDMWLNKGLNQ